MLIIKQLLALDQLLTLPTGLKLSLAQFHWQLSWFRLVLLRCLADEIFAPFPGRIMGTTLHKVLVWDALLYSLLASTTTWSNAIIGCLWAQNTATIVVDYGWKLASGVIEHTPVHQIELWGALCAHNRCKLDFAIWNGRFIRRRAFVFHIVWLYPSNINRLLRGYILVLMVT